MYGWRFVFLLLFSQQGKPRFAKLQTASVNSRRAALDMETLVATCQSTVCSQSMFDTFLAINRLSSVITQAWNVARQPAPSNNSRTSCSIQGRAAAGESDWSVSLLWLTSFNHFTTPRLPLIRMLSWTHSLQRKSEELTGVVAAIRSYSS